MKTSLAYAFSFVFHTPVDLPGIFYPTKLVGFLQEIAKPKGSFTLMSNKHEDAGSEGSVSADHSNYSSQHTSLETRNQLNAVLNKRNWSSKKAKKVAARQVSESYDGLLSRIIRLEYSLGRQPTLHDILSNLPSREVDLAWTDIIWLYPSICEGYAISDAEIMRVIA